MSCQCCLVLGVNRRKAEISSDNDRLNTSLLLNLLQNRVINGVYPASPASWFVTAAVVVGLFLVNIDVTFGCHSHVCSLLWYTITTTIINHINCHKAHSVSNETEYPDFRLNLICLHLLMVLQSVYICYNIL